MGRGYDPRWIDMAMQQRLSGFNNTPNSTLDAAALKWQEQQLAEKEAQAQYKRMREAAVIGSLLKYGGTQNMRTQMNNAAQNSTTLANALQDRTGGRKKGPGQSSMGFGGSGSSEPSGDSYASGPDMGYSGGGSSGGGTTYNMAGNRNSLQGLLPAQHPGASYGGRQLGHMYLISAPEVTQNGGRPVDITGNVPLIGGQYDTNRLLPSTQNVNYFGTDRGQPTSTDKNGPGAYGSGNNLSNSIDVVPAGYENATDLTDRTPYSSAFTRAGGTPLVVQPYTESSSNTKSGSSNKTSTLSSKPISSEQPETGKPLLGQLLSSNPYLQKEFGDTQVVIDPSLAQRGLLGGVNINAPTSHVLTMTDEGAKDPWTTAHELGHLTSQQMYKNYPQQKPGLSQGESDALGFEREADVHALKYLLNMGVDPRQYITNHGIGMSDRDNETAPEREQWVGNMLNGLIAGGAYGQQ